MTHPVTAEDAIRLIQTIYPGMVPGPMEIKRAIAALERFEHGRR